MARKKGEGSFGKSGDYHKWTLDLGKDPVTGKPRYKVIKRRDLKEVKRLVREYLRDKEDGTPSTQGNAITGDTWAQMWLETVKLTKARKTYKSYKDTWDKWLNPRLGSKLLERIGTADLQACVNNAIRAGHSPTARYLVVVVKTMLRAAQRHKPPFVKYSEDKRPPWDAVEVPAANGPRQRVLSHREVDEVLTELYRFVQHKTTEGGHHAYGYRFLIRFLLETGLRESEALGLQEFQVDLKSDPPRVHVAGQLDKDLDGKTYIKPYTKGKDDRVVFLSPAAVEAIQEQRKLNAQYRKNAKDAYNEWALTFPSEAGTPIGWRNFIRSVEEVRAAVNKSRVERGEDPMPHWTPHDLRRTFGTRIAQTGLGLKVTQKLMGHKHESTTAKIYVIADDEDMIKAVKNMKNRREA